MDNQEINRVSITGGLILKLIGILADAVAIGVFLGENKSLKLYCILLILTVVFFVLLLKIATEIRLLNLLMLVAKRGHLHTLRMILLVHEERKRERTFIKNASANFTFQLTKKKKGKSSIKYSHTFEGKRQSHKMFKSKTWLFGDDNVPPSNSNIRINTVYQDTEDIRSVGVSFSKHPSHDGIYTLDWKIPAGEGNRKIRVDLEYSRKNAFSWDRDLIFVVYPRSYIKDIKSTSFSVLVEPDDGGAISHVELIELSANPFPRTELRVINKQRDKDGKNYYSTEGEQKINENSVYIISVYLKRPEGLE